MKTKVFVVFMSVIFLGNITISAQGLKDFMKRMDDFETRLEKLDRDNEKLSEKQDDKGSVQKDDLQSWKDEIVEISNNGKNDVSEIENSIDQLSLLVNDLTSQMNQIKSDIDYLDNNTISKDIAINLNDSIREMRMNNEYSPEFTAHVEAPVHITGEAASGNFTPLRFETSLDATFMSKYVWRGVLLTDDPVSQTALTIAKDGLSLNIWNNMDLRDVNGNDKEVNELDYTLNYSFGVGSLSVSSGMIQYTFPNTDFDSTTEVYVGLSSEVIGDTSVTVFQDIGAAEGTYVSLGNGVSIPVGDLSSVDISGSLAWGSSKHNNFYFGEDNGAVTDFLIGVSVPFSIGNYFSAAPSVSYSSIVSHKLRNVSDEKDNLFLGLSASFAY